MTNSALGYQMMYEGAYLQASIEAEKVGKYTDAVEFAKVCAIFMGVKEFPPMPIPNPSRDGAEEMRRYYFKILKTIAEQGNETLINVRKDYKSDIAR